MSPRFRRELATEPAAGLSRGSLASIFFSTGVADENFATLVKSGVNEFQTDFKSFVALPDPGFWVRLFMVSISFLELTGVLVSILYIVAPRA